ncbi:MAG: hypothetical protein E7Z96_02010 [Actinomycetaceae bacterium]|nr:hypothetical protein [Actinomycetaceae bacterium]
MTGYRERCDDVASRLTAARQALAQAEVSVGLTRSVAVPSAEEAWHGATWNVPAGVSSLFPHGLPHGMTLGVRGPRLVTLLLVGMVSAQGAWTACVGMPDLSWAAVSLLGGDLKRMVHVPMPHSAAVTQVLAAAIDGFDSVVVGRDILLDGRERRLLSHRARSRGALLLAENWDTREQVMGSLITAEGMRGGSGHISDLVLELSRPAKSSCRIRITSRGWQPEKTLYAVPEESMRSRLATPEESLPATDAVAPHGRHLRSLQGVGA